MTAVPSPTRRRVGIWLAVVGVVAMALVAVGHVGSSLLGTRLPEGDGYRWRGETLYLKSLAGSAACRLDRSDGRSGTLAFGSSPSRRDQAWSLEVSNEYATPRGVFVPAEADTYGELTCSTTVRVGSGWLVHSYRVAESGLWTVIPALAAIMIGARLRKT